MKKLFIFLFVIIIIDVCIVVLNNVSDDFYENEYLEKARSERGSLKEDKELTQRGRELEKIFKNSKYPIQEEIIYYEAMISSGCKEEKVYKIIDKFSNYLPKIYGATSDSERSLILMEKLNICREVDFDILFFNASAKKCHSSCSMVCGNDNKSLSVLLSPLQDNSQGTVEIKDFFHSDTGLVFMSAVIYHRSLYHKEETFPVVQKLECFRYGRRKNIASIKGVRQLLWSHQRDDRSFLNSHELILCSRKRISLILHFLNDIPSVLSVLPIHDAAA